MYFDGNYYEFDHILIIIANNDYIRGDSENRQ